jgi:hypothetical protein
MVATSPYFPLIQVYFPQVEWERANCVSVHECSPDRAGYPQSCVGFEGAVDCGHGVVENARSWGIFQILDACWDPALNASSPFTAQQWAAVLDPNVNTWMASVIWSRAGWGAWTTCSACDACDVSGGPIPYPRGPIEVIPPPPSVTSSPLPVLLGLGLIAGGIVLYNRAQQGGLR